MDKPAGRRSRRGIWIVLSLIFLTGAFYRFWGLSSVYRRVDDIPLARHTERIYGGHWEPNPVYYYPVFFNYLVAGGLRATSAILHLAGAHPGEGLYPFRFDQVLLAARLLSAFLGSLTILLVFAIGRRLYGVREALLAAFFFSVAVIPILYSHQIVLDIPMTFFFALALFFCSGLLKKRRWPDYLLAGFACGLATATKYNGVFILAALLLGHLLGAPPARRRFLRAVVDPKIYAAGLSAIAGFFTAHPYAVLHFRRFIRASKLLIRVVHETESYLEPIQPRTLLEHVEVNKYVLALKNILIAEGPIFLALIVIGVAAIFVFRNRRTSFLALTGLAYFLGALGFLGFSRFRDLPAFAVFYSFFGMLGVMLISRLLGRRGAGKAAFAVVFVFVIGTLEFSAFRKAYILWEDDTTEVAERWIRRNIPKRSYFGKEWFSPSLGGGDYRSLSRPFLYSQGFAPFERFDFIITSSAANAHFFRNEKYYSRILEVYKELRKTHERIKEFYFHDIEYKNPEVHLYTTWNSARTKQILSLPSAVPAEDPAREFEMVDGSPYGKDIMNFRLEGQRKIERIFISKGKIQEMAVFVNAEGDEGEVTIGNSWLRKRLRVGAGTPAHLIFRPRLSFPFFRNIYKITMIGSESISNAVVRLCIDPFDIALEFFRRQDFGKAREYFLKALRAGPPDGEDLEMHLYLASCASRLGEKKDVEHHLDRAASHPLWKRYLGLWRRAEDDEAWVRRFEKFSGLSCRLLEETLSHHIEETISPELRLPAQPHRLVLRFSSPDDIAGPAGELEVITRSRRGETRTSRPIMLEPTAESGFSAASLTYQGPGLETTVQFIVKPVPGEKTGFGFLKVYPDLRGFFMEKETLFREFLDFRPGPESDEDN
ncbi:MAG: glycosyltransferase family 39 protein [Candidatus Aminicenantales bacterium]